MRTGFLCSMVGQDIQEAAKLLEAGELVAIPTETVYGLAANAFNEQAVLRIFQVKERPAFDPLIVHVRSHEAAFGLFRQVPEGAEALTAAFWPGPLTLVLPKAAHVPDVVTSGLDTVGVRMPVHPLTQELLRVLPFPLAAPSANPFGYISPTTAQHVADQLGDRIPYILDGGACGVGVESTILGWDTGWVLLRQGGVPQEDLEQFVGPLKVPQAGAAPSAPGMLAAHYAPRIPLLLGDLDVLVRENSAQRVGVISFRDHGYPGHSEVLSETGDLIEAARNLFSALRRLDAMDIDLILAERVPDIGMGRAINDRLARAAAAV